MIFEVTALERRKQYRVRPDSTELTVFIDTESIKGIRASVMDVAADGIAVVKSSETTLFEVGQQVMLRFEHAQVGSLAMVRAIVRHYRDENGVRIYGIEFIDRQKLHSSLPSWLFSLFNRRQWFRVAIPSQHRVPIHLHVETDGRTAEGRLIDISGGGVGITLDDDTRLKEGELLEIKFSLPASGDEQVLIGVVRNVIASTEIVQYGIEFDQQASENFPAQEQQIINYVMRAKKAQLRKQR